MEWGRSTPAPCPLAHLRLLHRYPRLALELWGPLSPLPPYQRVNNVSRPHCPPFPRASKPLIKDPFTQSSSRQLKPAMCFLPTPTIHPRWLLSPTSISSAGQHEPRSQVPRPLAPSQLPLISSPGLPVLLPLYRQPPALPAPQDAQRRGPQEALPRDAPSTWALNHRWPPKARAPVHPPASSTAREITCLWTPTAPQTPHTTRSNKSSLPQACFFPGFTRLAGRIFHSSTQANTYATSHWLPLASHPLGPPPRPWQSHCHQSSRKRPLLSTPKATADFGYCGPSTAPPHHVPLTTCGRRGGGGEA